MDDFGDNLRAVRQERGLSQADLATDAGVSPCHIGDYERGKVDIRLSTIRRLAVALECPVTRLVEGLGD